MTKYTGPVPTDEWEFWPITVGSVIVGYVWTAGAVSIPCDCHGWISVEDALPVIAHPNTGKHYVNCFVFNPDGDGSAWLTDYFIWMRTDRKFPDGVTHWKPERGPE